MRSAGLTFNGQREGRTPDTRIFSPVLYQLSYLPSTDDDERNDTGRFPICQPSDDFVCQNVGPVRRFG